MAARPSLGLECSLCRGVALIHQLLCRTDLARAKLASAATFRLYGQARMEVVMTRTLSSQVCAASIVPCCAVCLAPGICFWKSSFFQLPPHHHLVTPPPQSQVCRCLSNALTWFTSLFFLSSSTPLTNETFNNFTTDQTRQIYYWVTDG